jgi:hypothetical protein
VKPLEDLTTSFWVLNDKGEEDRLKLRGLAQSFSCSIMSGKIGLSSFANQSVRFCPAKFSSIFVFPISSGHEDKL